MGEFKKVKRIEPFVLKKKDPKTYSCLKELFVDSKKVVSVIKTN